MNKKEQIKYMEQVKLKVKAHSFTLEWLQTRIKLSRSHWYFLCKGERPLTDETKIRIEKAIDVIINLEPQQ